MRVFSKVPYCIAPVLLVSGRAFRRAVEQLYEETALAAVFARLKAQQVRQANGMPVKACPDTGKRYWP
jgi:hypothetical protein